MQKGELALQSEKKRRESMADSNVSDFIARMTTGFVPEKAAGIDATIQVKLTGAQPGEWYFTIKDGQCSLNQGVANGAKLTATADGEDFMKIFTGQMDGMQAFMQGKIRIAGDMNLALKLVNLFKMA
jgi:putative sterol carrier protein